MTQNAMVTKVLGDGRAYVSVKRQSACAKDCSECGSCAFTDIKPVSALAGNLAGAKEGDIVLIESKTKSIIGIAALVYLIPLALFFAGYGIASSFEASPMPYAALGAVAGWVIAWIYNRSLIKRGASSCDIVSVLKERAR